MKTFAGQWGIETSDDGFVFCIVGRAWFGEKDKQRYYSVTKFLPGRQSWVAVMSAAEVTRGVQLLV